MLSNYIFETIKNRVPSLTVGSFTHIYPQTLPEGVSTNLFVTYTMLRAPQALGIVTAVFQVSVFAKDYSVCEDLAYQIQGTFAHKIFANNGDPISTNSSAIVELPFDRDTGYFMKAVEITISSKKVLENYLQ